MPESDDSSPVYEVIVMYIIPIPILIFVLNNKLTYCELHGQLSTRNYGLMIHLHVIHTFILINCTVLN